MDWTKANDTGSLSAQTPFGEAYITVSNFGQPVWQLAGEHGTCKTVAECRLAVLELVEDWEESGYKPVTPDMGKPLAPWQPPTPAVPLEARKIIAKHNEASLAWTACRRVGYYVPLDTIKAEMEKPNYSYLTLKH